MSAERPLPEITARRSAAGNPYFALCEEDLIPTPGAAPYTYYHLDCVHDAVLVVPVLDDGRLVLERIYRHPYRAYMLEFPAGGIDRGEDPAHAAARELGEETGYRATRIEPLGVVEPLPGLVRMRLHVYRATGLHPGAQRSLEAMELLEVVERSPAEAWTEARHGPTSSFFVLGMGLLDGGGSG